MEEQRHDYPDILKRLDKIESQTNGGLRQQFEDLKQHSSSLWEKHDEEAKEFRSDMKSAIKEIKDDRKWLISLLVTVIVSLIGIAVTGLVKYGAMQKQVEINSIRLEKLIDGKHVK